MVTPLMLDGYSWLYPEIILGSLWGDHMGCRGPHPSPTPAKQNPSPLCYGFSPHHYIYYVKSLTETLKTKRLFKVCFLHNENFQRGLRHAEDASRRGHASLTPPKPRPLPFKLDVTGVLPT